ncbi:MAG: energy-coupling factor ABC transporter permease [Planctomycetota bacterium]|nr:energy-coupling factor ABC transporter permease [Planctomycetota bacterium]
MHIFDNVLQPYVWAPLAGVAICGVVVAEKSCGWREDESRIPLMGVLGAFIFAAQVLNIPVGLGMSGHLIGAALLAILVGPSASILVMACILIIQCLILGDGGVTALGANIVNLAIIASLVGWSVHGLASRFPGGMGWRRTIAPFVAGWMSVVIPSLAAALEIGLSGTIPLKEGLILVGAYHMLIGVLEGIITVGVLRYLAHNRPDILPASLRPLMEPSR